MKIDVPREKIDWFPTIDYEKCTGCGKCAESYCPAITMEGKKPVVDAHYCSCCAMCNCICPVEAFSYVPRT